MDDFFLSVLFKGSYTYRHYPIRFLGLQIVHEWMYKPIVLSHPVMSMTDTAWGVPYCKPENL